MDHMQKIKYALHSLQYNLISNMKKILLGFLAVGTIATLAACSNTDIAQTEEEIGASVLSADHTDPVEDTGLTLDQRMEEVMDLAHAMEENGMDGVSELFKDLTVVKVVEADDESNVAGMGAETWAYSEEDDVTVIICNMMNTPIHIFNGSDISQEELHEMSEMMMEMM
jgi:hypothetical protein